MNKKSDGILDAILDELLNIEQQVDDVRSEHNRIEEHIRDMRAFRDQLDDLIDQMETDLGDAGDHLALVLDAVDNARTSTEEIE